MKRIGWIFLGWLVLMMSAEAASINCAKAKSNIEQTICDKSGVTKIYELDEKMALLYKKVIKSQVNAEQNKQEQKQWLQLRDSCPDRDCVLHAYLDRLFILEDELAQIQSIPSSDNNSHYELLMSKNDVLCNHMYQLMSDDLKRFGRTYTRMYTFFNRIEEFNQFPWKPVTVSNLNVHDGKVYYWNAVGALIDLNNDGVLDFVIKDTYRPQEGSDVLGTTDESTLVMLDRNVINSAVKFDAKSLLATDNVINFTQPSLYELQAQEQGFTDSISPGWVVPFLYQGMTYLYIQSKYPDNEPEDQDIAVITKYIGGKFSGFKISSKMDDICYIIRK